MPTHSNPMNPPIEVRPLADAPRAALARIAGVLTDIDDTLTRDGAIEPAALAALQRLHDAHIPVIAITGRPMGWSEPFSRAPPQGWPVTAIVAENGAVALFNEGGVHRVEYAQDETTRTHNALRLRAVAQQVQTEVPGTLLARDSGGRVTDIAIDHAEFTQLAQPQIQSVVALMRAAGMNASVSSIHINGWFGEHDKWSGARWIVKRLLQRDLNPDAWVYVGDSTNDQVMFQRFAFSVGVANLMQFAAQLEHWPAYLTRGERGAGFAELANALVAVRGLG